MELKITSEKENLLLSRKELQVEIESKKETPRKEEIAGKIAALLNADKNLVVIERVKQKFGARKCSAYIKIYNNADELKKTEPKPKEKKKSGTAGQQQPAQQAAAAAQPVEQKKPAEKKEEKK